MRSPNCRFLYRASLDLPGYYARKRPALATADPLHPALACAKTRWQSQTSGASPAFASPASRNWRGRHTQKRRTCLASAQKRTCSRGVVPKPTPWIHRAPGQILPRPMGEHAIIMCSSRRIFHVSRRSPISSFAAARFDELAICAKPARGRATDGSCHVLARSAAVGGHTGRVDFAAFLIFGAGIRTSSG